MATVYCIENQINKKQYVGITRQLLRTRWVQHCHGQASDMPIVRAINKYGRENFEMSVLEECEEENLGAREQHWIAKLDTFKSGYNATEGGDGGIKGWKHTEDAKRRMSEARMGNKNAAGQVISQERRDALSKLHKGKQHSLGHRHTDDAKQKITEAQHKKVYQYTPDGVFVAEYASVIEAAKAVNGKRSGISRVCRGIKKHHRDHQWTYEKGSNINGLA